MKILIITAHPSETSFTHKIAETYKKASENNGHEIEIIDLYDNKLKQEFLNFENVKEIKISNETKYIQNKILQSNELIFIFPIWWADSPAIMKNFLDSNFTTNFAFKYENNKSIGLLNGKTAKIFTTCDGPGFFYKFPFVSLKTTWGTARLGFCGIKLNKFIIFDKMRKRNEKERENMLKKISIIASKK